MVQELGSMIREQILELARQSPDYAKSVELIEQRLQQTAFVAEDLTEAIEMLEAALQNPEMYPQMVQAAIADGLIDAGESAEDLRVSIAWSLGERTLASRIKACNHA